MDNQNLLVQLSRQLEDAESGFSSSQEIQAWAAKTLPLIELVDPQLHVNFQLYAHKFNLPLSSYTLGPAFEIMKNQVNIAIEKLKLLVATSNVIEEKYFPPGSQLDIQKAVSKILQLAKKSVWIIDPYMDEKIIEELTNINASEIKLITKNPQGLFSQRLKAAKEQLKNKSIDARINDRSHDRFYIIDNSRVWSLGTSYNKAGERGTLLHEMNKEAEKHCVIKDFNDWWGSATAIELDSKLRKNVKKGDQHNKKSRLQPSNFPDARPIFDVKDIENRIEETRSSGILKPQRLLILTAYPECPVKLKTLFSSKPGSLKSILENPPNIRKHGFGTRVLEKAINIRGLFCRVTAIDRLAVDLHKDGVLIAAMRADDEFLCWAMPDLLFNPIALIESIYNYVQLYELVLRDMNINPHSIYMRVDLRNLHKDGKKNQLAGGDLIKVKDHFANKIMPSPDDTWHGIINIDLEDFDVSRAAYYLTEILYLYFGLDIEEIPYIKEINNTKSIDISGIINP